MKNPEIEVKDQVGKKDNYFLMEFEGSQLLEEFALPVVKGKLAFDKQQAIEIAKGLGFPIVLKGMSREIVHKTEADIVKLNILDEVELVEKFNEIVKNIKIHDQNAHLEGILVQKMVPKGLELIVGIKKDLVFGHQLIIGMGGIFVEVLKDFSMKMMPVSDLEVEKMVLNLKGFPLLNGFRGGAKINMNALKSLVRGLNKLIIARPDIMEMDLNPVIFHDEKATVCDVRVLLDQSEIKQNNSRKSLEHIEKMINPCSIAVVGASSNNKKNGGRLFQYIVENGYTGNLFPININTSEIMGYKAYSSLIDVPDEIDLACIIVSAEMVPDVLEECLVKDVKMAIIHSSGFAETGEEGRALQERIKEIAHRGNMRLLGPNSMGIASPSINVYTAFGSALEAKNKPLGNIGFVSQSGAMGSALLSRAWEQGAGFSRWVSVANEADLNISEFINILAEDELTKVISVFMEGIQNAEEFKEAATKALHNKKPVLIYKTGKSQVGQRAVQSHTGSIAGDDEIYSEAFKKLGVLRVDSIEELIDVSRAFEIQPIPEGNRVGVITASGGACSVVADLCAEYGLSVPILGETSNAIKRVIPSFGSAQNPVDVTAEVLAKPEIFKTVLEALVNDRNLDGLIVMLTSNADPGAIIIAKAILEVFKKYDKPVIVGRLGANSIAPNAMAFYQDEKFPVYPTPEKAVSTMHYLVKYNEFLNT
ncbi:acetate--CoA ligase family protein [Peribacillus sp. NPDC097264]|uniref:acetate--CoA ligase family protein n=1 Tax=Peribacillus sp. NPDC097264 TaxID=3390616 RepID=UPI003D05B4B6